MNLCYFTDRKYKGTKKEECPERDLRVEALDWEELIN